ncbi:unnamed protein product [Bursaphelenchus okinawaensis]|uniref:Serine/threonine-protein kinase RIO3 n=1 Tax=Bursaphelenchus okinawaensis TaxID=465554 RepID=A0A811JUW4_9BILA|nr:unnamed protein product [Bursaphelenchus okinawaensis]CAG9084337.1 unnamed protein product [Bursaphelenchus okinawaensis]
MACWNGKWAEPKARTRNDTPPVASFTEIMSETLAEQLQTEEMSEFEQLQEALEASLKEFEAEDFDQETKDRLLAMQLSEDPDCSADKRMALELQRQFDREDELNEQLGEGLTSGGSTTVGLISTRHDYEKFELDDSDEDSFDEDECREIATNDYYSYQKETFPPCGFRRNQNGEIITKHNKEMSDRRNCQRLFQSSSGLKSGDLVGERINTKIANELERFGNMEMKRKARLKDKDEKAMSDASLDAKSRLILLKWINNGDIDRVEGVVAMGKESTVLHGILDELSEQGTSERENLDEQHFAIKVYKQSLNAFRNRGEYIKNDFRFKNPRNILKVWATKEYMNLQRLNRAEMPCPTPLHVKRNVLLMTMVGTDGPAKKLRDIAWDSEVELADAFEQVKQIIIRMFRECKLVHGDLSEFNLLYNDNKVYVIDVAQAVDVSHPRALEFLARDIENVLNFFAKTGLENLPTSQSLFTTVTDLEMDEAKSLIPQVEAFEHENRGVNVRLNKANPSDCELSRMLSDQRIQKQQENDARHFGQSP